MLIELKNQGYKVNELDIAAYDCGIYFLYFKNELVYIGKSKAIRRRVIQHIDQGVKMFDKCLYILFPEDELDEIENGFINRYKPKYNTEGKKRQTWHKKSR